MSGIKLSILKKGFLKKTISEIKSVKVVGKLIVSNFRKIFNLLWLIVGFFLFKGVKGGRNT